MINYSELINHSQLMIINSWQLINYLLKWEEGVIYLKNEHGHCSSI